MCGLCRVAGSAAHLASGWHAFNLAEQKAGRVPVIDESVYQRFHAGKAAGAGAGAGASDAKVNKQNARNWHWTERDFTPWAKTRLLQLLQEAKIAGDGGVSVRVTKVPTMDGHAIICNRKQKLIVGFEFDMMIEWKGETRDAAGAVTHSLEGTAKIPDFSTEEDHGEWIIDEIQGKTAGGDAYLKLMRAVGRKAITKALCTFVEELTAKKKEL